ncbi:MAG: hypothetical protein JXR94_24825 [Candidatus Hydrogenedentes bacterium]|nr:hypothetical protein [Candidatus Hydrogenedentota bacterium]
MTLLETLVYIAVLAVIVNLTLVLFISGTRLSLAGSNAVDRMMGLDEIDNAFTRTVRQADAVCGGVGDHRTGPDTLVLALHPAPGEDARFAVFGRLGPGQQRLSRLIVVEKNGAYTSERFATFRPDLEAIRFDYDTADPARARCISLWLDAEDGRKQDNPSNGTTLRAAIRTIGAPRTGG